MSLPSRPHSKYEALAFVAAGGMATVHVGRARGGQEPSGFVALKSPHPHLVGDPSFRRMFLTEGRLGSRVAHPNVVGVLEVEEREDALTLVMPYIEGGSLSELTVASGAVPPLSLHAVLRIILDAIAGVEALHALEDEGGRHLRVVHRDVSPHNILVGLDGIARLTDLGIAKPGLTQGATASAALRGKFAYMSPEHVQSETLDGRSDVFGLGVTAWEALTGKHLFRAHSEIETVKRLLTLSPSRPSRHVPAIPKAVDDVILRALEKSRDARWPSAREFREALAVASRDCVATRGELAIEVERLVGPRIAERHRMAVERAEAIDREGALAHDPGTEANAYVTKPLSASVLAAVADSRPPGLLQDRRVWGAAVVVAALAVTGALAMLRPASGSRDSVNASSTGVPSAQEPPTPRSLENPPDPVEPPSIEIPPAVAVTSLPTAAAPAVPPRKRIKRLPFPTDKAPPNPYAH